jgi:hypothetical protein
MPACFAACPNKPAVRRTSVRWKPDMTNSPTIRPILPTLLLAFVLGGCAAANAPPPPSGRNLTPEQCRDLTALKNNEPPTKQRNMSELAALRRAGYDPSPWYDPYYPDDLHAAQRLVDSWYKAECLPPNSN